mgnify:CR=1 FL=1
MEYVGTSFKAEEWEMKRDYVSKLCREGKIEGAEQDGPGKPWRIPISAKKPEIKKRGK